MPAAPLGDYGQQWSKSSNAQWESGGGTHLGGFNNPTSNPGFIEQRQDQRLGQLGAAVDPTQLPQWQQNQQGQFQGWANQSQQMQQQAYAQALAQFNGAETPAQQALFEQNQAAGSALGSMAQHATGGARGAAAAMGNAQMLGAGVAAQGGNAMLQQQLADKYAAADLMSSIANQQRGLQQGEYGYQAQLGAQNAAYQQGWNGLNDQAALWADTMKSNRGAADIGYQVQNQGLYNQQEQQQLQNNMNMLGAGANAAGGAISWGASNYNNGGGGGSPSGSQDSPYGLGNNPENPWWSG